MSRLLLMVQPALLNLQTATIGLTPLIYAIQGGHMHIVEFLIEHNCDVNLGRLDNGVTPIFTAAVFTVEADEGRGMAMLETLLRAGANANHVTFGELKEKLTPLLYLATTNVEGCKLLGCFGAELDCTDSEGQTVAQYAESTKQADVLAWIEACKSFNQLQIAVHAGRGDTLGFLLAQDGVDVNKPKAYLGDTPLIIACSIGNLSIVKILLAPGWTQDRLMVGKGGLAVDLNMVDKDGNTALIVAVLKGHTAVVAALLDAKEQNEHIINAINVSVQDNKGYTAHHYATTLHPNTFTPETLARLLPLPIVGGSPMATLALDIPIQTVW